VDAVASIVDEKRVSMDDRLIAQVNATATSLREAAQAADDELRAEQQERDAIDARIQQLQALKRQLEDAIAQAEGTAKAGAAAPGKRATRKRTSAKKATRRRSTRKRASARNGAGRQDAVLQVLSSASGPMRPADVAKQLRQKGREDSSSQVSATLAQLARSGRATKVEHGLYAKSDSS
jgi:hypothetical protein